MSIGLILVREIGSIAGSIPALLAMNDIIELLLENNRLLKEIRSLLLMQYDSNYIQQQDLRAFSINVAADIFVELMENNPEFKDKIKNTFK